MSTYKLYYFDARGVTEPIRLILAYFNVKFEDVRVTRGPEWTKLKPHLKSDRELRMIEMPWNVVPVLEVDGEQISQSLAIFRFLARRFGLVPSDELQLAKCDEYIDAIVDLRTEGKKFHRESDLQKKISMKEQFLSDHFARFMNKITVILKKSGSGYLVGNRLTHADIFVAYTVGQITSWTENEKLLNSYPEIKKHEEMVMSLPGIKEWIETRPKTAS